MSLQNLYDEVSILDYLVKYVYIGSMNMSLQNLYDEVSILDYLVN